MELNGEQIIEKEKIKDLKISKFGWTTIYAMQNDGSIKCILIKKNLFKGYTVLDENSQKRKITDLTSSEFNDLSIISHFKTTFMSKDAFSKIQDSLTFSNVRRQNELNDYNNKVVKLENIIKKERVEHNEEKINIQDEHSKEVRKEKNSRIYYISESFDHVATGKWTEEGTDIEYEQPNALQRQIGRTIGNIIRKPYSREGSLKVNMADYLCMLNDNISEEYKLSVKELMGIEQKISSNIASLYRDYNDSLYIQTVALIAGFTTKLKELLVACKSGEYKDKDIYYYKRSTINGRNDEDIHSTSSVPNLIKIGIDSCSGLLEKFEGEKSKNEFLAFIEESSNIKEDQGSTLK